MMITTLNDSPVSLDLGRCDYFQVKAGPLMQVRIRPNINEFNRNFKTALSTIKEKCKMWFQLWYKYIRDINVSVGKNKSDVPFLKFCSPLST